MANLQIQRPRSFSDYYGLLLVGKLRDRFEKCGNGEGFLELL